MKNFKLFSSKFNFVRGGVFVILFFAYDSISFGQSCTIPNVPIFGQANTTTNISQINGGYLPQEVILRGQIFINLPNYSLSNITIYMDEGAQIFVPQNITLNIYNNVRILGCFRMWKGIYVDGTLTSFTTNKSTSISGAEAAITGTFLTGGLSLNQIQFSNNLKDIVYPVGQTLGIHKISYCNFNGGLVLAPYNGQQNWASTSQISLDFQGCTLIEIDNCPIDNYAIGVKSDRSNINISNCDFSNVSDVNVLMYNSNSIIDHNTMLNMNNINYGMHFTNCGLHIRNWNVLRGATNFSRTHSYIYATQTQPFVDHLLSIINGNSIFGNDGSQNSKGIHLWNNSNWLQISRNFITLHKGTMNNNIDLSSCSKITILNNDISNEAVVNGRGISILNSSSEICFNKIDITNKLVFTSKTGIHAESSGNYVGSNNIYTRIDEEGFGNSQNSIGVLNRSSINSYICNFLDTLSTGIRIEGPGLGSILSTNIFGKGDVGLEYNNIAITGDQILKGNLWRIGGHSTLGARHFGNQATVNRSRYFIDRNNVLTTPPVGYTYMPSNNNNLWFQTANPLNITMTCNRLRSVGEVSETQVSNCREITQMAPTDGGIVEKMADGTLASEQPDGAYNILQRQLYNSMKTNGDYTMSFAATQLYQSYENGVIRQFEDAAKLVNSITEYSSGLSQAIKETNTAIYTRMNSIMELDTLGIDSSNFKSQLISELAQLSATRMQLLAQIRQEQINNSNQALSVVNLLPTSEIWMQNEKSAYTIFINYMLTNQLPSEADKNILKSIALQCVAEGGLAVSFARAMYSGLYSEGFDDNCSPIEQREKATSNLNISVFPNPASESIRLTLPYIIQQKSLVKIYDRLGNQLDQVEITESSLEKEIDISKLSSGLYTCQVEINGEVITQKFVVIK